MIGELARVAYEAGAKILEFHDPRGLAVETKADNSPVTAADMASHEAILRGLNRISALPVLSEEASVEYAVRKSWDSFWLVDPLDGTKDFLAGNGEFSVNIALVCGTAPVFGLIYSPCRGELYYAEKGKGAFLMEKSGTTKLPLKRCVGRVMLKSRFHDVPEIAEFAEANRITESRTVGAALKFALLARGDASIYPRYSGSKEWDIAAGHILISEAGCRITDLATMAEPVYNKPVLANNYFVAHSKDIGFGDLRLPSPGEGKK